MDRYKWLKESFPANILGNCLSPSDVACNACFANLCDLHPIQCFLSFDISVMVTNALFSSHLD